MLDQAAAEATIRGLILRTTRRASLEATFASTYALIDNGVIDSLGLMELVAQLERAFDVVIEDEDILPEHFENLASVVGLVMAKVQE